MGFSAKYKPTFVWLLTNSQGQRAVVIADDTDEARQLADAQTPRCWHVATCENIAETRPSRVHKVLAMEK
jgi:hypothetical protein